MRTRLLIGALVVVVVAVLVWAGLGWWQRSHRTDFERSLDVVPASTQRVSFTDWHAIRERLGVDGTDTSGHELSRWLDRAYDRDYSTTSPSADEAVAMAKYLGFSAAGAQWEVYGQSDEGAADVIRMEPDVDLDDIARELKSRGFKEPESDDGVWNGGPDLLATIDPEISPEFQYVVLLREEHLVVASDKIGYLEEAAKVASGDGDSVADELGSATDMAGKSGDPVAAMMWTRDFACSDLAMSTASPADQRRADRLIAAAGQTSALSGLVMAMSADRVLTVAEEFESGEQARENLQARAKLAVGPAVGRGGDTFASDFTLTSSRTDGSTVLLRLKPHDPTQFVLSALYDGPVIFATC